MDGCFKLKMIKKWEELMCIEHINFFFGGTEKQRQSENKVTDGGHKLKDVKSWECIFDTYTKINWIIMFLQKIWRFQKSPSKIWPNLKMFNKVWIILKKSAKSLKNGSISHETAINVRHSQSAYYKTSITCKWVYYSLSKHQREKWTFMTYLRENFF